jgi:hypothetical protein
MLFDSVDAAVATTPNSFIFPGFTISDFIQAIIAILAFAGLIASIWASRSSLNQAKNLFKVQMDISLLNERYAVTEFFIKYFGTEKWTDKNNEMTDKFYLACLKTQTLFKNGQKFLETCQRLSDYYDGKPLPDYRKQYADKKRIYPKDTLINKAFAFPICKTCG